MDPADVANLVDVLNPDGEEGRLTLIHRCGAEKVAQELPPIIEAVSATGKPVLWICDPMHGNTKSTSDGMKTRDFNAILSELEQAFDLHADHGTILGGVHFELTGEDVTECTGGARGLDERGTAPGLSLPGRSATELRAGAGDGVAGGAQGGGDGLRGLLLRRHLRLSALRSHVPRLVRVFRFRESPPPACGRRRFA